MADAIGAGGMGSGSQQMAMIGSQQSDQQAVQTQQQTIQHERMKNEMDRLKNKESLRDHLSKQASKIHEGRGKVAQDQIRVGESLTRA
jgi:hypothetical protein